MSRRPVESQKEILGVNNEQLFHKMLKFLCGIFISDPAERSSP